MEGVQLFRKRAASPEKLAAEGFNKWCAMGVGFASEIMRHGNPHHELKWEIPGKMASEWMEAMETRVPRVRKRE